MAPINDEWMEEEKSKKSEIAQHELSNDFLLKKDSSEIETLEDVTTNIDNVISDGATDLSQIFAVVQDTRQRLIVVTNISSFNEFFLYYIRITGLQLQCNNFCMFG